MATYYNPPTDIPLIGRRLPLSPGDISLTALQSQCRQGEVPVIYADRLVFKFASLPSHEEDVRDLNQQYLTGHLVSMQFYAVPSEKLEGHV